MWFVHKLKLLVNGMGQLNGQKYSDNLEKKTFLSHNLNFSCERFFISTLCPCLLSALCILYPGRFLFLPKCLSLQPIVASFKLGLLFKWVPPFLKVLRQSIQEACLRNVNFFINWLLAYHAINPVNK